MARSTLIIMTVQTAEREPGFCTRMVLALAERLELMFAVESAPPYEKPRPEKPVNRDDGHQPSKEVFV